MRGVFFFIGILISVEALAQSNMEEAKIKKDKAVELMDNGKPDEAIQLLEEAKRLDPDNWMYDYEKGYAYYIKNEMKTALKIFKEVIRFDDATDRCYQMLGNLYDINGEPGQALKTYDKGLKKFPVSGRLYLEKGNVYFNQKKYLEALPYYEMGIKAEPMYPSNYYRATLIFCGSSEVVWGMIYGEIFMNLERNSKRTAEISKLLFESYKNQIGFKSDTVIVSFSKSSVITVEDVKNEKLPFGAFVYEPVLLLSVPGEMAIDINTLDRIRRKFVENYYLKEFDKKYPNVLFEYQNRVLQAGHLEAYNHWLLMKGEEDAFAKWKDENKERWTNFMNWFEVNGLRLYDDNKFYRGQY